MEDQKNIKEITQEEIKKKYNILYRIGEGGFGSVYKAFSIEKNQIVALKEQKCLYNELEENIKIEQQILQYKHINIIEYYEIFYIFDPFFQNYHLYVSMEYCDYDLLKLISIQIEKNEPLSQQEQLNFYLQILQALHFLHSKKITHGDLKPENILIKKDENGKRTIKLSDFGTIKNQKTLKTVTQHSSIQGTYIYLPKEVFENEKVNYFKVDAFCFGLTVLLMCGTPFIKFQDIQDIQKNDKLTFKTLINQKLTDKGIQLFEILHIMLEQDYKKRSDILNSYETIVQFIKNKIGEIQFNKLVLLSYEEKDNKVIVKLDFANGDLYEGEILDNKRNGYGKQIWKNGAIYEGNWLNNNKHGQGIYKNKEGDYYEGNWFKNKKQGHGILISERNDIFYEGSWVNDMQNGYGKYKNQNGDFYEGNWIDNKLTGQGKIFKKNGDIWEVNFQNNKVEGNVKITFKSGIIYEGDNHLNSNQLQTGKLFYPSGILFEGAFFFSAQKKNKEKNGLFLKHGQLTYPNQDTYKGPFKKNQKSGKGLYKSCQGSLYEGEWATDLREGFGKQKWPNKNSYEGEWFRNLKHGKGTFFFENGDFFQGQWFADKKLGDGKLFCSNGEVFEGYFDDHFIKGKVKYTDKNGKVQDLDFKEGKLIFQ